MIYFVGHLRFLARNLMGFSNWRIWKRFIYIDNFLPSPFFVLSFWNSYQLNVRPIGCIIFNLSPLFLYFLEDILEVNFQSFLTFHLYYHLLILYYHFLLSDSSLFYGPLFLPHVYNLYEDVNWGGGGRHCQSVDGTAWESLKPYL